MRIGTRASATTLAAALLLGAGCGDDSDDSDGGSTPDSSQSTGEADTNDDGGAVGDAEVVGLTEQQICDALPAAAVGAAIGLEITEAAVGGSSTAQCAYSYRSESGGTSNLTIASLAGDTDLGGRSGDEAFDYVIDLNRGLAGDTEFDEVEVEAGDRSVRFTGESLHLGVLAVDGHILTLIVPAPDADGAAVDALLATMAERLED